ncbi:MAG: hypothetical protein J5672_03510 [Verrucomicrobia bacterium]|nr:hypothetical protein [Verrucomicrobiota bacterium]
MDTKQFYYMYSHSSFTARAMDDDDDTQLDFHNLKRGDYENFKYPIRFKHSCGTKKLRDILDTEIASWLISERLKNVLEENQITGWKTYPIQLFYKKMEPIEGYYGFSVVGRSGPVDFSKSEIIKRVRKAEYIADEQHKGWIRRLRPDEQYTYTWEEYKGWHIDLDTWDGSDFFLIEGFQHTIVTQRVVDVLKGFNRQITFTNLMDQRIKCSDVKGYKKEKEDENKEK